MSMTYQNIVDRIDIARRAKRAQYEQWRQSLSAGLPARATHHALAAAELDREIHKLTSRAPRLRHTTSFN